MSTALAKKELHLEKLRGAIALRQKAAHLKRVSEDKIARARALIEKGAENRKTAILISPLADTAGKAAEAYGKAVLDPETHKYIGPAAAVASIVFLTLAATAKRATEQQGYLAAGEFCVGSSSRFVISQLDQLVTRKK